MIISCIHVFPTAEEFNFCGSRCVFVACHAQNVTNSTHSCNWYTNKSFSPIPFTTFCWEAFHTGSARGARHPALRPPQQEVMSWQSRTDAPIVAAGALGRHIWGRASHQPIGGGVGVGRRDQCSALCDDFGFANVNCCSVSHWGCQSHASLIRHQRSAATLTPPASQAGFRPERRFTDDLMSPYTATCVMLRHWNHPAQILLPSRNRNSERESDDLLKLPISSAMNTEISDSNQSVCSVEFIYYFNLWTDKSPVLVICSRVAENLEMQKCLGG